MSPHTTTASPAHYPAALPTLQGKLTESDQLQAAIDAARPLAPELWQTLQNRLRTDWTYHSNSIEGSTLTRGETHFFLTEGLTVEGKPFKDFVDAKNHAEAVDMLFELIANKRPITESILKEINALLLQGVTFTPAKTPLGQRVRKKANPGLYKLEPNHVEQPDGTIHHYVEPLLVKDEMERLVAWVNAHLDTMHPLHTAAVAHYNMVRIHPFDDGNGRGARLLMNLILMNRGYSPAVIRIETKRRYLETLKLADQGDVSHFVGFVADAAIETQKSILDVLQNRPKTEPIETPHKPA